MSILVDTKYRSDKLELMDDFSIEGPVLHDTLDKLTGINKWLGGRSVTMSGLKHLLRNHKKDQPITCIDLGCGDGDMLRKVANYGRKSGIDFKLIGVDANENTVAYGRKLSAEFPNIDYVCCDVFSEEFNALKYDIVLATLFLHHFSEDEVLSLLKLLMANASVGIVVNDLHRHRLAYYLFTMLCLTIPNTMVKEDGLTSILRGFKRTDLEKMSQYVGASYRISWKWAFRYQWIIEQER